MRTSWNTKLLTAASSFLAGLGANVIDADKLSRAVTAPGGEALPAIVQTFGADMLDADGHLDRRRLAQVVFSDDASRRALEGIIHPLVQQATLRRIRELAAAGASCAVLDVPLLYETGMDVLCDEVWLLAVPHEDQVQRIIERDGLDEEQALRRINSQMSMDEKQARCDRVIWTNRSIQATQRELESLWQMWMKKVEKGR